MQPAFALPAQFTFGNAPRNVLRGPRFISTDLSFMKNLPIGGGARFQFRTECYNIFNNVNYGNPDYDLCRPPQLLGRITSAGTHAAGAARRKDALLMSTCLGRRLMANRWRLCGDASRR